MKQIVVISGKGGTGKTILTASLSALAKNAVFADCDVDAADLHLLLNPTIKERREFKSGKTAKIIKELCVKCGRCISVCRFDAISDDFVIDPVSCEGCGVCSFICPAKAIVMEDNLSGEWFISSTKYGPLVHAKLGIAEENSGKLVSLVRQKAKELAEEMGKELVIVDGPPGIGCPVIASLANVDLALIVTEPTLSGIHDLERVLELTRHFKVKSAVCINKYDINAKNTADIEDLCKREGIEVLARIPFDKEIVKSLVSCMPFVEYGKGNTRDMIVGLYDKVREAVNI